MVEEKFLELGGKKVHYFLDNELRNDKTIVFLHGKSFKAQTWIDLKPWEYMSKIEHTGLYVDIPGWGLSEENPNYDVSKNDYSDMSKFINDLTSKLNLNRYLLLGASFSVPFVLRHALDYPNRVSKLILVGGVYSRSIEERLPEINLPVLIIYGKDDTVVGLEPAEKYSQKLRKSKKIIVEGARHPLYLDKPHEFFESLIDFIKNF